MASDEAKLPGDPIGLILCILFPSSLYSFILNDIISYLLLLIYIVIYPCMSLLTLFIYLVATYL